MPNKSILVVDDERDIMTKVRELITRAANKG